MYGYVCLEAILLLLTGLYNTWIVDWTGPWTKAETNMKFKGLNNLNEKTSEYPNGLNKRIYHKKSLIYARNT